ncbi:MAG TPA: HD domain-containing protein [bacterium]|nr:HD domain-containing protein [bacterium]HMZ03856.1 HD domain-containing protein [bacterium]HNB08943.1 HD domain-containing protein [bacterium]HNB56184.1 HD domain-containing protein [bacterium]HNC48172.1 HD domain-containing protein [bacterium]
MARAGSIIRSSSGKDIFTRRDKDFFEFFGQLESVENKFNAYLTRFKYPKREKYLIRKAYDFSSLAHKGQLRNDGAPYIIHPIRVASILLHELSVTSADMICSALLHDVIEDCGITENEIKNNFNESVASMVRTLTKNPNLSNAKRVYFEAIMQAEDHIRLVKLCDRLDNLRSLRLIRNKAKTTRYIKETEGQYLPIAAEISPYLFRELRFEIQYQRTRYR